MRPDKARCAAVDAALAITAFVVVLGCHAQAGGPATSVPSPQASAGSSVEQQVAPPSLVANEPAAQKGFAETLAEFTKTTVNSGVRIVCGGATGIGSGFIHSSGVVVTAAHVAHKCSSPKQNLTFRLSDNTIVPLRDEPVFDDELDLALLVPATPVGPGLKLYNGSDLTIGTLAGIWGFPDPYRGARPLLTMSYLSGGDGALIFVNGEINPGNSGGPLLDIETGAVLGVIVRKFTPEIPEDILGGLRALGRLKGGVIYKGERDGSPITYTLAQLIERVLAYLHDQAQLGMGIAVGYGPISAFLQKHGIAAP
jgi:hypothetical protein